VPLNLPSSILTARAFSYLVKLPVAVEKGTKAVISGDFSVFGERTFNNLQTNFAVEIP